MSVEIRVGGVRLAGFQRGALQFSLQELTASFDVEYAMPDRAQSARPLFAGNQVSVLVAGHEVLDGYVDTTDDEDGPDALTLRAAGRSRVADLVDCTAEHKSFRGMGIVAIARALAQPFDVEVELEGDDEGDPFPSFHVQKGETTGDAILRGAQLRGLYPHSVGRKLLLTRVSAAGAADAQLVRGTPPLMRTGRSDSWFSRFSTYIFRGQVPSSDEAWGAKASQLKSAVVDEAITRYRPLQVQVEAHGIGDLETRALMVKNQRAGQGERIVCTCVGLLTPDGKPWRAGMRVHLTNPALAIDDTLIASQVRMRFGEAQPEATELELTRPEAFDIGSYKALKSRGKWYRS